MASGIYCIKCIPNNKVYVGQSKNIGTRWNFHISNLIDGKHDIVSMQEDYDKYGGENFVFSLLESIKQEDMSDFEFCRKLDEREAFFGNKLKADNPTFGYNRNKFNMAIDANKEVEIEPTIEEYLKESYHEIVLKLYKIIVGYYNLYDKEIAIRLKNISDALNIDNKLIHDIVEELAWDGLLWMKLSQTGQSWLFKLSEKEYSYQKKIQHKSINTISFEKENDINKEEIKVEVKNGVYETRIIEVPNADKMLMLSDVASELLQHGERGRVPYIVYIYLLEIRNKYNNKCSLSIDDICEETNISRTTVKEALTYLSDNGLLVINSGTNGETNNYYFPREWFYKYFEQDINQKNARRLDRSDNLNIKKSIK